MSTAHAGVLAALLALCITAAGAAPDTSARPTMNGSSMQHHITPASTPAPASSGPLHDTGLPSQDDMQRAVARVKAEYLYRFLGYVEFPRTVLPQPDSPLVIGVTGADDVFDALADTLSMRTVGSRAVVRKRLSVGDSLQGVHLLFVGRKVDLNQDAFVSLARSGPVLLVTDAPGGLGAGAVFNFLTLGEQLRFEASLEAARRASLKVSSRVLVLAERVVGGR